MCSWLTCLFCVPQRTNPAFLVFKTYKEYTNNLREHHLDANI